MSTKGSVGKPRKDDDGRLEFKGFVVFVGWEGEDASGRDFGVWVLPRMDKRTLARPGFIAVGPYGLVDLT